MSERKFEFNVTANFEGENIVTENKIHLQGTRSEIMVFLTHVLRLLNQNMCKTMELKDVRCEDNKLN